MNLDLTNKTALVCGSTQGIGRASAVELALLGANIILLARNEDKLKNTLRELHNNGKQHHHYYLADFSNPETVQAAASKIISEHTIHILVNNTGGPPGGPAIEASVHEYIQAFNSHLICNQIMTQAVVPAMKEANYGRIINIISTSVKIPLKGLGVSNTIRGAVANWSKTLSFELASFGITVNNVLPGATMTGRLESLIQSKADKANQSFEMIKQEMINEIPAARIGDAHEVAAAVAFLASPAASYINGINVPVDGGRTGNL